MSGHSKWASIKHKKAIVDAKRGQAFTKLIRELTVAAKNGGGNPEMNPRLRLAISNAKNANMPADNIERAIKKGTGELEGIVYEEITYEGYGPGGVAIMAQCLTDNKNRTAAEIRSVFNKRGGNMAGSGTVSWQFEAKGLFLIDGSAGDEEQLMDVAVGAGAEDFNKDEDTGKFEVTCNPKEFDAVRKALEAANIDTESADITMLPKNLAKVDESTAKSVINLLEALEEQDDVQNVYSNIDIPKELL